MALPKVTYGQYNYGQYANPTPIKYKGGFGEGLAQAAVKFAEGFEKGKKEGILAKEQAFMASTQYEKQINKALGNAQSQNREFVIGLKQEVGDLVKGYKLGRISLDEYSKSMDKYNGYLNDLQLMRGTIEQIASSNNPEIDLKDVRFGLDNIGAAMTRNNLQKQNFIISENAKEDGLNFSLPSGLPSDFKLVNMSVKDLIKDDRYYTPQIKFDAEPTINALSNSLLENIPKSNITYQNMDAGTRTSNYGKIIPEKIDSYLDEKFNKETILGGFNEKKLEAYFEDDMGKGFNAYQGTEEQNNQIFNDLKNKVKNKLLSAELNERSVIKREDNKTGDGLTPGERQKREKSLRYYNKYQKNGQALASFLATDPKNQNFVFNAAQNMGLDVVPLISNDEVIGYQFANPELGNTGQVLLAGYTTGAGNVKIANILGATDAGIEIESNEQENESAMIYDAASGKIISKKEFEKKYKVPSNVPQEEPSLFNR